jgi:hypothetical protein
VAALACLIEAVRHIAGDLDTPTGKCVDADVAVCTYLWLSMSLCTALCGSVGSVVLMLLISASRLLTVPAMYLLLARDWTSGAACCVTVGV